MSAPDLEGAVLVDRADVAAVLALVDRTTPSPTAAELAALVALRVAIGDASTT